MKFYVTLSKKHLALILAVIIIAFLIFGQLVTVGNNAKNGATNALRVEYIKSIGYEPDDSGVHSKNIVLPQSFSKVYKEYNALQKEAGFDLGRYKGESATVYTYPLAGSEKQLHLIVCDGKIIGGDVADVSFGGEMKPLLRYK